MMTFEEMLAMPKMREAIGEIERLILEEDPSATFEIDESPEPEGVYLRATVDVVERTLIQEKFIGQLADFQIEDELPLYVVLGRTPKRMKEAAERIAESKREMPEQLRHGD